VAVLLSLLAACSYGLSDFVGGIGARRTSPWVVAFVAQVAGATMVLVAGLVLGGSPTGSDWAWALLAGVGNGLGTGFLYRGLASGRMAVVGPVSAVGAALLPVVVGVVTGDRPAALAWVGVVVALPAIWLVAREPGAPAGTSAAGLADGVLAGVGFGTLFAALAQVPEESGLLPLALNQAVGAVAVAGLATAARSAWRPREASAAVGLAPGVLGTTATVLFLLATQQGLLTLTAVIASLYPAVTVVLAAAVLREHVRPSQGAGLAMCAVAVTMVVAA